jgi:phosphatidylglycerophosphate synthase
MTNVLAAREKKCLIWLAARMPRYVNSDHLTTLALVAMFMAGVSFVAATMVHRLALAGAIVWLAVNWFGDSLDGTLARVRRQERPRYGFYVDHLVDCLGVLFLFGGLTMAGYMSPLVALGVVVAYYFLSIEIFLATYCLGTFRMSFGFIGPTELRLLLAVGVVALFFNPTVVFFGQRHLLFDVGGAVAIPALAITAFVSAWRSVRSLYAAEPVDRRDPEAR